MHEWNIPIPDTRRCDDRGFETIYDETDMTEYFETWTRALGDTGMTVGRSTRMVFKYRNRDDAESECSTHEQEEIS